MAVRSVGSAQVLSLSMAASVIVLANIAVAGPATAETGGWPTGEAGFSIHHIQGGCTDLGEDVDNEYEKSPAVTYPKECLKHQRGLWKALDGAGVSRLSNPRTGRCAVASKDKIVDGDCAADNVTKWVYVPKQGKNRGQIKAEGSDKCWKDVPSSFDPYVDLGKCGKSSFQWKLKPAA